MTGASQDEAVDPSAQSLLEQLQSDFSAEGKTTCKACLRSKAMPSVQVLTVLREHPECIQEAKMLRQAQSLCLSRIQQDPGSSLDIMSKLATAMRFGQLLCYCYSSSTQRLEDKDAAPTQSQPQTQQRTQLTTTQAESQRFETQEQPPLHDRTNTPDHSSVPPSKSQQCQSLGLSIEKVDEMFRQLVHEIDTVVGNLLRSQTQANASDDCDYDPLAADISLALDARAVACFTISSLIRLQNVFGMERQQWLVPLASSIGRILVTYRQTELNSTTTATLPITYAHEFLSSLQQPLDEGTALLTQKAAEWCEEATERTSSSDNVPELQHFMDMVSFVVGRCTSIVPLLRKSSNTSDLIQQTTSITFRSKTLWKILTTLRGLAAILDCHASTDSQQAHGDFVQRYHAMASKVERRVLSMLTVDTAEENVIRSELVQSLLELKLKSKRKSSQSISSTLLCQSRIIGRALLLQRLLRKQNPLTLPRFSDADRDCFLGVCEFYHAVAVPQCFGILARSLTCLKSAATSRTLVLLLSEASVGMVNLLHHIQITIADQSQFLQFQRLMLRWMSVPSIGDTTNDIAQQQLQHPLQREFLLWTISSLITSTWSRCSEGSLPTLLSLFIQLLFDPRSGLELRRNASNLLVVVLTSTSSASNQKVVLVKRIEHVFASSPLCKYIRSRMLRSTKATGKRKKRHATSSTQVAYYTQDHMEAIGRVLARIPRAHKTTGILSTLPQWLTQQWHPGRESLSRQLLHSRALALALWCAPKDGSVGPLAVDLVEQFVQQLQDPATTTISANLNMTLLAFTNMLTSIHSKEIPQNGSPSIDDVANLLLTICTSKHFVPTTSDGNVRLTYPRQRILLSAIALLGSLAKAIPESNTTVVEVRCCDSADFSTFQLTNMTTCRLSGAPSCSSLQLRIDRFFLPRLAR